MIISNLNALQSKPVLRAFQPWMLDANIYVADDDFVVPSAYNDAAAPLVYPVKTGYTNNTTISLLIFAIWDSNSSKDDEFDIYLNGQYMCHYDASTNADTGIAIVASAIPITTVDFSPTDFAGITFTETAFVNPATLALGGSNLLEMRNTGTNNNSNFGSVEAAIFSGLYNNNVYSPELSLRIFQASYSGGDGYSFSYHINLPTVLDSSATVPSQPEEGSSGNPTI